MGKLRFTEELKIIRPALKQQTPQPPSVRVSEYGKGVFLDVFICQGSAFCRINLPDT